MRTRSQSDRRRRVAINTFTDPQTTGTQSFSCEHGLGSFQTVKHVGVRCSKSTDSQTLLWFDLLLSHLLTQSDVGTAASAAVVTALGGNSFTLKCLIALTARVNSKHSDMIQILNDLRFFKNSWHPNSTSIKSLVDLWGYFHYLYILLADLCALLFPGVNTQ